MPLKVLVIDDSAYHRRTLSRIIAAAPEFEVVGTAGDGEEAIKKVVTLQPDLLTLDLEMPRMDGFTFLRWLMRTFPRPTLVVSSRESNKSVFRALELGAADFVLKPVSYASEKLGQIEGEVIAKLREIAAARPDKLALRAQRLAAPAPAPARAPPARKKAVAPAAAGRYRCVAIGASTGGPPALQQVLTALAADLPAAVVIAQHMPEGFTRMFAERLDRIVGLRVKEADGRRGAGPRPRAAGPGGKNLTVQPGMGGRRLRPARGAVADRPLRPVGGPAAALGRGGLRQPAGLRGPHRDGRRRRARDPRRPGRGRADHRRGRGVLRGLRDAAGGDPDRGGAAGAAAARDRGVHRPRGRLRLSARRAAAGSCLRAGTGVESERRKMRR